MMEESGKGKETKVKRSKDTNANKRLLHKEVLRFVQKKGNKETNAESFNSNISHQLFD